MHAPCSSKYFIHFLIFIDVHVIFIQHNCFGVNFIHTFKLVKLFIQIIHLLIIIIQKVHWCLIFIQTFHLFYNFHPCTCEKIFSTSFLCDTRIFLKIFYPCHQNIPNIFVRTHKLMLTGSHSCSKAYFLASLVMQP